MWIRKKETEEKERKAINSKNEVGGKYLETKLNNRKHKMSWNPPPSSFFPRHLHKNQPIDSKLFDF